MLGRAAYEYNEASTQKTKGRDAIQQGRRMFEILSRMFPPFLPLFNSVVYELDLSRSWLSSSHLT